jgi:hypothetical protein
MFQPLSLLSNYIILLVHTFYGDVLNSAASRPIVQLARISSWIVAPDFQYELVRAVDKVVGGNYPFSRT